MSSDIHESRQEVIDPLKENVNDESSDQSIQVIHPHGCPRSEKDSNLPSLSNRGGKFFQDLCIVSI